MGQWEKFIKSHPDLSISVALFLTVLLFFLPGLFFDVIPMDISAAVGGGYLQQPIWENFIFHLKHPASGYYPPLTLLSVIMDHTIWRSDMLIGGGRLHNIILHGGNGVMFFMLLRQLKLRRLNPRHPLSLSLPAVIIAVLCFLFHPQRVESLLLSVGRQDVQALFCGLAGTLFFIRAYRNDKILASIIGAVIYFISFRTAPLLIALPVVLLAGIWCCTEKADWRKSLKMLTPYAAVSVFHLCLMAADYAAGKFSAVSWNELILNYIGYFFKTLLPTDIQPMYADLTFDRNSLIMMIVFGMMVSVTVILSLIRWRYRFVFTAFLLPLLAIYLLIQLPYAGFHTDNGIKFADRYSYCPSLFITLAFAVAYEKFALRRVIWQFVFWAYASLTILLGCCYLQTWQSRESFVNAGLIKGKKSHPLMLKTAALECFYNHDFEQALNFAECAVVESKDADRHAAKVLLLALNGMICLEKSDLNGLAMTDLAIADPAWGQLCCRNAQFAEKVLLKSAAIHQQMGSARNVQYAIKYFQTLADMAKNDPVKRLSYLAYAAYLAGDHALAEKLTVQALEKSPDDPVLLKDLADYRKFKNSPAKAASN